MRSYVREADYTYYDGTQPGGNAGDLQLVQTRTGSATLGGGTVIDTTLYRYYSGESGGASGLLKYVFGPAAYDRMVGAGLSPLTTTVANDSSLLPYADNYFVY